MSNIRDKVEQVFDFQNKRIAELENALRFYANVDNYRTDEWESDVTNIDGDCGRRARKVLYGDEE